MPSVELITPAAPANKVTTPPEVIFRIVLLCMSATYTLFAESTATPAGTQKFAAVPVPLFVPATLTSPASVETAPAEVIFRINSLPVSAT